MPVAFLLLLEKDKDLVHIRVPIQHIDVVAARKHGDHSIGKFPSQSVQERSRADQVADIVAADNQDL
jgi:hypothetical protein